MSRALVIHPGALGDVLLALPALAHLRAAVPGIERVLAVTPRLAALLGGCPAAEVAVDLDSLGLHHLFAPAPDPALVERLAVHDLVVSWLGSGDPVYRARLGDLASRPGRRVVIARAVPDPSGGRHASWHLVDTLAALGPAPGTLPAVCLAAPPAERAWAAEWLGERGLVPGRVAVLHPGAGSPAKVWPEFPALGRRLGRAGLAVVVVTGPAEAAAAAALAARAGGGAVRLARDLSLRQLAALFEAAAVFVGNDSGLSHLAAAVGAPTLALFGPTDPRVWAPLGPRVAVLAGAGRGAADPWRGLDTPRVERAALEAAGRSLDRDLPEGARSRPGPFGGAARVVEGALRGTIEA
jgi:ADP-heptose:LPS heptosyltransferase